MSTYYSTTDKENVANAIQDWKEEIYVPDLYVCLDECYIYSITGDDNGVPRDDADIIYDTVPDEILQLDIEKRNGKYVRCIKPVEGWVFLPVFDIQYDWAPLSEMYLQKKRVRDGETDEYGHMKSIDEKQELKHDHEESIEDERRDYSVQRMMMQTVAPEVDKEANKLMQCKCFAWLTFYFRRHPMFLAILLFLFEGFTVSMSLFDVYSDINLALELRESGNNIMFMFSWLCITAPYFIAWCVASQLALKTFDNHSGRLWTVAHNIYNFVPCGILILIIADVLHWIECVLMKPIFAICTCSSSKRFRIITTDEEGYYKFRIVIELFAEAIPQTLLLTTMVVFMGQDGCSACTNTSVFMALASSIFQTCKISYTLISEAKHHGLSLIQYIPVVFRGSFNFLPLYQQQRTLVNVSLSNNIVGQATIVLNSRFCRLKTLKVSKFTFKDCHRISSKAFGDGFRAAESSPRLIVSRTQEEIKSLFSKFDIDEGKSVDFVEFLHLGLDIKSTAKERCLRSEMFLIYEDLVDPVDHEVWQVDLETKVKNSLEYINLIDYSKPLLHAFQTGDLKMISLLMASGYAELSDENYFEFKGCVIDAIATGKVREAMCLCEDKGIPMVVRMENGRNLIAVNDDGFSDPYVMISIFDSAKQTKYKKHTLNPTW
eukprot:425871_1